MPGSGLVTVAQAVPFQWSTNEVYMPEALLYEPTAHTSLADTAAIPLTLLLFGPGLGLFVMFQASPQEGVAVAVGVMVGVNMTGVMVRVTVDVDITGVLVAVEVEVLVAP